MKKTIVAAACLLLAGCREYDYSAKVVDRIYSPSTTSTGISNGNLVVVSSNEEYKLELEFPDGHRDIIDTDKKTYLFARKGCVVHVHGQYTESQALNCTGVIVP